MWEEYNSSDAFILPTFSEGSAMVVLNAWTAGKISLTTVGCNLEKGLDQCCNILIETNMESIKAGILKLIGLSDVERFEFGQIGKKIVQENYSWRKITAKYIIIYQDVITIQMNPLIN
jgi:poly(glycerol-phosphate) alpha-glucosyltransferase